jgi:molecular chaperone GrpE
MVESSKIKKEENIAMEDQIQDTNQPLTTDEIENQVGNQVENESSVVEESPAEAETITISVQEWNDLKQQAEENHNRLLRSQADFDNFRRRTRQEREDLTKYASSKLIESLLPAFDNLERALQSSKGNSDFESLAKGLEMVFRQMEQTLSQEGLQTIEAVGQPFDPELHQAVMQEEVEGTDPGIVVQELQKGFKLKDKVLRPSMVKVSL